MSKLEKACIKSWEKYLPDYQFKLWNESNFDVRQYGFTQDAYVAKKYAFVSDVARLHAVYYDGGIYFDTDMLLLSSMDSFLRHPFFTGYYRPGKFNGAVFGCEQYNPIAKLLLERYASIAFDQNNLYLNPDHFDAILTGENYLNEIVTYPPEVFYPLPFEKRSEPYEQYITSNSVAVHLWNHSWKNEFSALQYFLFQESLYMHVQNIVSLKPEFRKKDYLKRYYQLLYRSFKKYLYLKIYH